MEFESGKRLDYTEWKAKTFLIDNLAQSYCRISNLSLLNYPCTNCSLSSLALLRSILGIGKVLLGSQSGLWLQLPANNYNFFLSRL